jgi:competence protein ComEA
VFPFRSGGKEEMKKECWIIVLLMFFGISLAACGGGGKQYEIELLSPDPAPSSAAETSIPESETIVADKEQDSQESACYFVHICGAVREPGVYEVAVGSRIFEVLELAGGFTEEAATDAVNLATTVIDGSKIRIPTVEEALSSEGEWVTLNGGDTASVNTESGSTTDTGLVNINTASLEQLMTLPGIGQAKAESIIAYREEQGRFETIEDIMRITGIKEGVFNRIKDKITI